MEFESEEPSKGTFTSLGNTLEYLVNMNPLIPANTQRGAVHETDASTLA
jgi:hypothetical protein